jgi:hypothetical protein
VARSIGLQCGIAFGADEERIFPLVKVSSAYTEKFVWFLDLELRGGGGNSTLSIFWRTPCRG